MSGNQYQHFISRFLLKNFKEKGKPVYKCENGKWTPHNICKTGGEESFYGSENCSLEVFFGDLENIISAIVNKHIILDEKDKAYLKIFILLMAYRSPYKNQIITEKYESLMKSFREGFSDEEICFLFYKKKKEHDDRLTSFDDDSVISNIIYDFPCSFNDSDNSKFFPLITKELLQVLPKIGKLFSIQIIESEHNIVIGDTPTLSANIISNEVKTNGEEAGLIHENVIYWLPIAYNKVVFMYSNLSINVIQNRKLSKQEVDILNYFQKKKSPSFYSKVNGIEIPELLNNFSWINDFRFVFECKKC